MEKFWIFHGNLCRLCEMDWKDKELIEEEKSFIEELEFVLYFHPVIYYSTGPKNRRRALFRIFYLRRKTMELSMGQKLSSFAELCRIFGEEPRSGAMKKTQERNLRRYCEWEKTGKGHQITITKIYDKPQLRLPNNKTFPFVNGSYLPILLELLQYGTPAEVAEKDGKYYRSPEIKEKTKIYEHTISKTSLYRLIGLCNKNFSELKTYVSEVAEFLEMDKSNTKEFFETTESPLETHLNYILKELKNRCLINNIESDLGYFCDYENVIDETKDLSNCVLTKYKWKTIYPFESMSLEIKKVKTETCEQILGHTNLFLANQNSGYQKAKNDKLLKSYGLVLMSSSITFFFDYDWVSKIVDGFTLELEDGQLLNVNDYIKNELLNNASKRRLTNQDKYLGRQNEEKYFKDFIIFSDVMIDKDAKLIYEEVKAKRKINKQT